MSPTEGQRWARRFERLLDAYPRDDGTRWTGSSLRRATGGAVSESWVSKLKNGRLSDPGFGKIAAISRAMGVPLEAWIADPEDTPRRR